jgi:hypothetical protein
MEALKIGVNQSVFLETLLGPPKKGCDFTSDQGIETLLGERRRQGADKALSATTAVEIAL